LSRDISIAQQVGAMKREYPSFVTQFVGGNAMRVEGAIRPTSRSIPYQFVLTYNLAEKPKTKIVSPRLEKNFRGDEIPHLYPGEYLCLYRPKYWEFRKTDLLTDTIIHWTSLWLYFYEQWHVTGEWLGGGEHPGETKA
jgi:hypothetical protein